jgi:protein FAM32A
MPADDYTSAFVPGALRLKGAKVTKPKKTKKNKDGHGDKKVRDELKNPRARALLEDAVASRDNDDDGHDDDDDHSRSLIRRDGEDGKARQRSGDEGDDGGGEKRKSKKKRRDRDGDEVEEDDEEGDPRPRMTEAERRHEELKRKRVSSRS